MGPTAFTADPRTRLRCTSDATTTLNNATQPPYPQNPLATASVGFDRAVVVTSAREDSLDGRPQTPDAML
jgi:hypothetical protein